MALVVEDGSGVPSANTFILVADADAYFSARGIADWTGEASSKEASLIRAMDWLNGLNWRGDVLTYNQPLCWPRYGVPSRGMSCVMNGYAYGGLLSYWPSNEIPSQVKDAQCEAALRYLDGTDMMPDLDRGGRVVMEKVDVITTQYESGAPAGKTFPAIMALLRPFLLSSVSVEMGKG